MIVGCPRCDYNNLRSRLREAVSGVLSRPTVYRCVQCGHRFRFHHSRNGAVRRTLIVAGLPVLALPAVYGLGAFDIYPEARDVAPVPTLGAADPRSDGPRLVASSAAIEAGAPARRAIPGTVGRGDAASSATGLEERGASIVLARGDAAAEVDVEERRVEVPDPGPRVEIESIEGGPPVTAPEPGLATVETRAVTPEVDGNSVEQEDRTAASRESTAATPSAAPRAPDESSSRDRGSRRTANGRGSRATVTVSGVAPLGSVPSELILPGPAMASPAGESAVMPRARSSENGTGSRVEASGAATPPVPDSLPVAGNGPGPGGTVGPGAPASLSRAARPRGAAWLLSLDGRRYTLQIASLPSESAAREFIRRSGLSEDLAGYYLSRKQVKLWYPIVYGVFDSARAAREAARSLPPSVRRYEPFPRRLEQIHRSIGAVAG